MMNSKFNKKKLISFLAILTLVLLGVFNLNLGYAIQWEGDGATFEPDVEHPTQYGVFIPEPNIYATMYVDASNQGRYAMMNWLGGELDSELVDYPGKDISHLYPWYFDSYVRDTTTDNDYLDPWDVNWINVTALNPQNNTLSPYTLNSVFDYYVMTEGNSLNVPVHSSFPMQIDLVLNSKGPKILKFDWLTDDPTIDPLDDIALVSPSGKLVDSQLGLVEAPGLFATFEVFNFLAFVAHQRGTYRLLINAAYAEPMSLALEFLKTPITNLPLNTLRFGGNGDDNPSIQDLWDIKWQNDWFRINGKKGDMFRLDIGIDYTDIYPQVNFWAPCANGYVNYEPIAPIPGIYDVYFPATGPLYVSFIDETVQEIYRYSLYLSEFETLDYNIGDNLTTIRVDRDQRKAIEFDIEEDSFVEFNYTLFPQPLGNPTIYAPGGNYYFLYENSKRLECVNVFGPIETKPLSDETFYYYYLPAGTYKAFIANTNVNYDGVVQISSKYVEEGNGTIPINYLTYPDTNPSQFLTVEFDPHEYYNGIHEGKYVYLNITEPGQYILNTTIYTADNLAGTPLSADPAAVVVYNSSAPFGGSYHDWTEEALDPSKSFPAFSNDTAGEQTDDILFIAYSQKWHDMEFNFSQVGIRENVNLDLSFFTYDGTDFTSDVSETLDTTTEFTSDGTIVLNLLDPQYLSWIPGADFDLPGIKEDDYYWLAIQLTSTTDFSQLPYIQLLKLSNITLQGDVNFALIRDSGYEYGDYWNPTIETEPTDLLINQEATNLYDSSETLIFETSSPYTIGFEEGVYKLLIIPYGWGGVEPIKIKFAVENYWSYRHQENYNITAEPNLYLHQINNYTAGAYGQGNTPVYNYSGTYTFNSTETILPSFLGSNGYFVLECFGDIYKWTQLVVATNNVSQYELYIMQDLPWVTNTGPHDLEVESRYSVPPTPINTTNEFGVLSDHFYLIFEFQPTFLDEIVTFRIDLTQYNTTILTTSVPIASYKPPLNMALVLGLAIGIPVAAGIIVMIYVLKKRGKILSKTP
ncbi:MAG: hypothetical protein ACFFB0_11710 [Promethearchaeota archaeon]